MSTATTTVHRLDYPAADGRPVTEAHTRMCRVIGHGTHTIGGTDTGRCPRCGESAAPATVVPTAFTRALVDHGGIVLVAVTDGALLGLVGDLDPARRGHGDLPYVYPYTDGHGRRVWRRDTDGAIIAADHATAMMFPAAEWQPHVVALDGPATAPADAPAADPACEAPDCYGTRASDCHALPRPVRCCVACTHTGGSREYAIVPAVTPWRP